MAAVSTNFTTRISRKVYLDMDEIITNVVHGDDDVVKDGEDVGDRQSSSFPLSKQLDHSSCAFRIGSLCVTNIGAYPHDVAPDELDIVIANSEVIPVPVGFTFERSLRDWTSTTSEVKISCTYLKKPHDGIPPPVDLLGEDGVIERVDRRERMLPPGHFAWRVVLMDEVIWVQSLVDVIEVLRDEAFGDRRAKKKFLGVFDVYSSVICGLDHVRLRKIVRSLRGFGAMSRVSSAKKDRFLGRARVLRDLVFDSHSANVTEAETICSSARTAGRFKTTRRKVRRIGRCEEAAGWSKYAASSMGAHHVRPSAVVHVSGAVCTMPSSAVLAKYRTMKTLERENTIVRPVFGEGQGASTAHYPSAGSGIAEGITRTIGTIIHQDGVIQWARTTTSLRSRRAVAPPTLARSLQS